MVHHPPAPQPLLMSCDGTPEAASGTGARTSRQLAVLFTDWNGEALAGTRALYGTFPAFRSAFDALGDLVDGSTPVPLVAVVFAPEGGVDSVLLKEPRYGRIALFAHQVALFRLWQTWGMELGAVAGHGIGELSAAHVAGALSLRDAVRLVTAREACSCLLLRPRAEGPPDAARTLRAAGFRRILRCGATGTTAAPGDLPALSAMLDALHLSGSPVDWDELLGTHTAGQTGYPHPLPSDARAPRSGICPEQLEESGAAPLTPLL